MFFIHLNFVSKSLKPKDFFPENIGFYPDASVL